MKKDIIEQVANTLIERLENFSGEWEKPFISVYPHNVVTGKPYRGINTLILAFTSALFGYHSASWGTFKQWQEKGYHVKKGEKATTIVFWKPLKFTTEVENTETGELEAVEEQAFVARAYNVFNGSQIEGWEDEKKPDLDAMTFFENTKIRYSFGANLAAYDIKNDVVLMPERNQFINETAFISTIAHETVHATGHENRLNRDMKGKFGNEAYAFEELIADIGAGFVAGYLGYEYQFSKDNLAYLKSWLKVLKNDKKAIFKACSHAQAAFDYLLTFQEV